MKKSLKCGLKADETRVFIAIESCSGRESGGKDSRFDLIVCCCGHRLKHFDSRKVPSESVKNIAPSNDLCLCPFGGRQEATGEREGGPDRGRGPRSPNRNEPGAVSFGVEAKL